MEVDGFYDHAALGHHPSGYGAVDASAEEDHSFAVGAQGQAAEALYLLVEDVCPVVSQVYVKSAVGVVDVDFQDFTAYEDFGSYYSGYIRGLDGEVLICALGLDFKCLDAALFYLFQHECYGCLSDFVQVGFALDGGADAGHAEDAGYLADYGVCRDVLICAHENQPLMSADCGSFYGTEVFPDTCDEGLLEVWLVHAFQGDFADAYYVYVLFVHLLSLCYSARAVVCRADANRPDST